MFSKQVLWGLYILPSVSARDAVYMLYVEIVRLV